MKKVSTIFCNPTAWWKQIGSAVIRWGDKSEASHTAILVEDETGAWIYESVFPTSRKLPLQEWLKIYKPVKTFSFEVDPSMVDFSYLILDGLVGKYYSIGQLVFILFTNTFGWLDRVFNNKVINHERGLICTEVNSRYFEAMGLWDIEESHDKIGVLDVYNRCLTLVEEGILKKEL